MENSELLFKKHFGYTPYCNTKAPGVVELLGSFAGTVDGLALTIAIDKSLTISSSPRVDGKVEIISSHYPDDIQTFWVSDSAVSQNSSWRDYIKSLINNLQKRGAGVGGFNAFIHSDLPVGAGFETSAALLCATALSIRKLYPFRLTETGTMLNPPKRDRYGKVAPPDKKEKLAIAALCKYSDFAISGQNNGVVAELTSLFAKRYYAMSVDSKFNSFEYAPVFGEIAIIAFIVEKSLSSGVDYCDYFKRLSVETAAALSTKSLRSVEINYLKSREKILKNHQFNFAYHIATEIQRVIYSVKALEDGDFEQFCQYLILSHQSVKERIGYIPVELDFLTELCLSHRGCYGSRMIVSRKPSTVISIVAANDYEDFIKTIPKQFYEKTNIVVKPIICAPSDCAG